MSDMKIMLGTTWKHRRKGGIYRITQIRDNTGDVWLEAQSKGCRSTWKYVGLIHFDYEKVEVETK